MLDIVLGIMSLLSHFERILYIDIDVHHGDGVEEAFVFSNRVCTMSFHNFAPGYYPGTGSLQHKGEGDGVYFTHNIPLHAGYILLEFLYLLAIESMMTHL